MIVTATKTINGREFIRTVSDAGFMIERDGVRYSEAYDPVGSGRVYAETDELDLNGEGLSEVEEKAIAFDILTGVSE